MKRILSLVLVICLCVCMPLQAYAAPDSPRSIQPLDAARQAVSAYPLRMTGYADGYVGFIQRAMCVYSEETRDWIMRGLGENAITVDAIFGEKTAEAVMVFQKHNGLTPDGVVGSNTWKALAIALGNYSDTTTNGNSLYSIKGYVVMGFFWGLFKYYPYCSRSNTNATAGNGYRNIS